MGADLLGWMACAGFLIGAGGTVTGLLSSFQVIETMKHPTPGDLAVGIYESLTNLDLGLATATLFFAAHVILKGRTVLNGLRERNAWAVLLWPAPPPVLPPVPAARRATAAFRLPVAASMTGILLNLLFVLFLNINLAHGEIEDVRLPVVQVVDSDDSLAQDGFTINIYHRYPSEVRCTTYAGGAICHEAGHWRIVIHSRDCTDERRLSRIVQDEADARRAPGNPSVSLRTAMIRADAAAPFGLVRRVVEACRQAVIKKIEFGVALPPPASPGRGSAQQGKGGAR
jgi:hypothetical protein